MSDLGFDPEVLKKLAKAKKLGLDKSGKAVTEISQEDIDLNVEQLEQYVFEFALEGHLRFDFKFGQQLDELRTRVAIEFKTRHPRLMVLNSAGENKLTITWDGNNHV